MALPFVYEFPKGKFPIQLATAYTEKYKLTTMAKILFSTDSIVKWESAIVEGQKPVNIKDSLQYCSPVDAGMIVFIDSVSQHYYPDFKSNTWENVYVNHSKKTSEYDYIHNFGNHNMAILQFGQGDGCYTSYISKNAKNEITSLLIDFAIIPWWGAESNKTPAGASL